MLDVKRNGCGQIIYNKEQTQFILNEYYSGKSFTKISEEQGVSLSTIRSIFHHGGGIVRTDREQALKFTADENFFEIIDTEEKAYWLGFFYADGFIQCKRKHQNYKIGITLTESDKEHLEKFKKSIKYTGTIKTYQPSKGNYVGTKPYSKILITSNKLALDLIKNGCVEQKTDKLIYPSSNIIPKELEKHFIRGLIDGDGSVKVQSDEKEFAISFTGTRSMCQGVLKFFGKDKIKLHQRHPDRPVDNYSFEIGGRDQVVYLLSKIYDESTIYLDRKYEKYLRMLEIKSR